MGDRGAGKRGLGTSTILTRVSIVVFGASIPLYVIEPLAGYLAAVAAYLTLFAGHIQQLRETARILKETTQLLRLILDKLFEPKS